MKWHSSKIVLFLFSALFINNFTAQTDSTIYKLSAIQLEINTPVFTMPEHPDQQTLQTVITGDEFLYLDLSKYKKDQMIVGNGDLFKAMPGVRFFLNKKHHGLRREFFLGLRYGEAVLGFSTYSKIESDTVHSFVDPRTQQTNLVIRNFTDVYNFVVSAKRLYLPLGLSFTTRQDRFLWLSVGLEFTPFISFDQRFSSFHYSWNFESVVVAGQQPRSGGTNDYEEAERTQKLSGVNSGICIGMPITIYLHPFRKNKHGISRFHAYATLTPLYASTNYRFSGPTGQTQFNGGLGLRYNFNN